LLLDDVKTEEDGYPQTERDSVLPSYRRRFQPGPEAALLGVIFCRHMLGGTHWRRTLVVAMEANLDVRAGRWKSIGRRPPSVGLHCRIS
jgi:hypothetical protein